MPRAYSAALMVVAASCAPAGGAASDASARIAPEMRGARFMCPLMMFLRHQVRQVSFHAWQRFREHCLGIGVELLNPRIHNPRLQQYVGVFHRRSPGERAALAVKPFDHVQVLATKIPAYLE